MASKKSTAKSTRPRTGGRSARPSWTTSPTAATPSSRLPRWFPAATRRCSSPTPAWSSSRTSSWARTSAPTAAPRRPKVHARLGQAQRSGERRPLPAASHLLRDARQLLLRRLLQARRDPLRLRLPDEVYGLDPDRLYFTVHESDDEALHIWLDEIGVPPERVVAHGRQDQLLADGRHRPLRPDRGDPLRLRPRARTCPRSAELRLSA